MVNNDLFHTVQQLARQLTKHLNQALEPFGLYSAQWSVLYVLKTQGTLTQKQLCDYLAVEAPPMTRNIQRLIKQGYVEQVTGPDRRAKYIRLTQKAYVEYPKWEQTVAKMNHMLLEHFPQSSQEQLYLLTLEWLSTLREQSKKE